MVSMLSLHVLVHHSLLALAVRLLHGPSSAAAASAAGVAASAEGGVAAAEAT